MIGHIGTDNHDLLRAASLLILGREPNSGIFFVSNAIGFAR